MDELIRKALDKAGYNHMPANRESLIECYLDSCTAFGDSLDDIIDDINCDIITDTQMCNALIRCN